MPGVSAGRVTDTRYQRLYCTLATHVYSSSAHAVPYMYGKASTCEDKSSKSLHPVSPPIKTIIWCCFDAGVDAVMLRSEEKANKRRRMVWSWISFKLMSSLWSASFDVSTWSQSSSLLFLLWWVNTKHQASKIGPDLFHVTCVSDARW